MSDCPPTKRICLREPEHATHLPKSAFEEALCHITSRNPFVAFLRTVLVDFHTDILPLVVAYLGFLEYHDAFYLFENHCRYLFSATVFQGVVASDFDNTEALRPKFFAQGLFRWGDLQLEQGFLTHEPTLLCISHPDSDSDTWGFAFNIDNFPVSSLTNIKPSALPPLYMDHDKPWLVQLREKNSEKVFYRGEIKDGRPNGKGRLLGQNAYSRLLAKGHFHPRGLLMDDVEMTGEAIGVFTQIVRVCASVSSAGEGGHVTTIRREGDTAPVLVHRTNADCLTDRPCLNKKGKPMTASLLPPGSKHRFAFGTCATCGANVGKIVNRLYRLVTEAIVPRSL